MIEFPASGLGGISGGMITKFLAESGGGRQMIEFPAGGIDGLLYRRRAERA